MKGGMKKRASPADKKYLLSMKEFPMLVISSIRQLYTNLEHNNYETRKDDCKSNKQYSNTCYPIHGY